MQTAMKGQMDHHQCLPLKPRWGHWPSMHGGQHKGVSAGTQHAAPGGTSPERPRRPHYLKCIVLTLHTLQCVDSQAVCRLSRPLELVHTVVWPCSFPGLPLHLSFVKTLEGFNLHFRLGLWIAGGWEYGTRRLVFACSVPVLNNLDS